MKKYLEIAKIVAAQGIHGEIRCQYYCDGPEVLCGFETLYLGSEKERIRVIRAFPHKNVVVMRIDGIDSIEDTKPLIGKILYIDRANAELPPDTYFIQDIIGLEVKDVDSGEVYGKVSEVYQNGASDVYSIKKDDGRELMFPCIDEVVKSIDTENGIIMIKPLAGLFEDWVNGDED